MGSSPRMRGTRHHARLETVETGIIPAYAGNTRERHGTVSDRRDHPRVCGEHLPASSGSCTRRGSSPRMRGTQKTTANTHHTSGIIPAYAGNTQSNTMRGASVWDHPRVCGEHGDNNEESIEDLGSSPRMRGTPYRQPVLAHGAGIIPAYAGNTRLQRYQHERCRDHPRVCGEHCEGLFVASGDVGSSPRMRGTPARYCASRSNAGIIPAYAGNTSFSEFYNTVDRDHPRVCGEHLMMSSSVSAISGSSPRMRGTLSHSRRRIEHHGIIPAYAGNTGCVRWRNTNGRDHPRVCGEHIREGLREKGWTGSSPRMRGTL